MRWAAGAMLAAAVGGMLMAAPEWGAADWNREMTRACAAARENRPTAQCPEPKREDFRTDWLLIAAVLGVGGAVVLAISARKG